MGDLYFMAGNIFFIDKQSGGGHSFEKFRILILIKFLNFYIHKSDKI
jgi:hypothetical protein